MNNNTDIVAITESKRNDDYPIGEMHTDFKWIGKNRADSLGGGIGLTYNTNAVSITDEDILGSLNDPTERLWVGIKTGKVSSLYALPSSQRCTA